MRCLPLIVLLAGAVLAASTASAQQGPGGTRPGGAARPGATMPKAPKRSWVKLCEPPVAGSTDIFGKSRPAGVKSCLVHQEQLEMMTGSLMVAAGVEEVSGQHTFLVKVPAGLDREPGVRLMIVPRALWQKVQRRERVALEQSKGVGKVSLAYSLCGADGCLAETKATPELLSKLKSSGGLLIIAQRSQQPLTFMVTLSGFREAFDGPPVDAARYYAARAELLRLLREGQTQGFPGGGLRPKLPGDGYGGIGPKLPPGQAPGAAPPKGPGGGMPGVPPRRPGAGEQDI
jgi:invasion protein IalB